MFSFIHNLLFANCCYKMQSTVDRKERKKYNMKWHKQLIL